MADRFPLSLPAGTCAVSLPWHDRNDDQAWLVEAAEAVGHTSTWTFGKVRSKKQGGTGKKHQEREQTRSP